jgi:hypothetical protein
VATGDGLRVLIVEDETAVADTLRVLLKHKVSAHPDLAGDCATARKNSHHLSTTSSRWITSFPTGTAWNSSKR